MSDFIHLHVHTEYSLLDGAARIKDVIEQAKKLNMSSVAITDHGVMYGVLDFYKAAKKAGIKPIIGCEIYVSKRNMLQKESRLDDSPFHLVLLAENNEGYQNLVKIVSAASLEGFYYKPRADKELLRKYSKGLIALSACAGGEVATLILQNHIADAKKCALEYQDIFGVGNYYLELQDHGIPEQRIVNAGLVQISNETAIPLVCSNDVHYTSSDHAKVQDVLLCIQTSKTLTEEGRMKFSGEGFYFKSSEEMTKLFAHVPQAVSNTVAIAERCNVEFNFGEMYLPNYIVPEGYTLESYLDFLCGKGLDKRYPNADEVITQRLKYELEMIVKMGFAGYFLIVWDLINYAKNNDIPVGPGRGSAAGSLVAYVLGITNVDPLKYDLLFERFLNPERVSMPDIDIDFCFERRDEIIHYIIDKYGTDHVAQIITFGTMAAKAAVRDVGRVLALAYSEVDKVAKLIPTELNMTLDKAMHQSSELMQLYDQDERIRELLDLARQLEGMPRHASTHAAGVVISQKPLTEYCPLQRSSEGLATTQFAKETVEEIGLLKMDILGLRTLTVIADTLSFIRKARGVEVDIDNIPLDDKKAYNLLAQGLTKGVFQLESPGMRTILKNLKPERIEDIIALVALYRPGPLGSGMVDDFINRKHGRIPVQYMHPLLEPILKETYGVILYQEQVMRIANDMAGFSLGQADLLRRAMGKKKVEVLAAQRDNFVQGAKKNEIDGGLAGRIFDLMESFAGYGFNKSHSAAYAIVAYQTAYLKANYPTEFMAALLTSLMGSSDRIPSYIEECKMLGIKILSPDINESAVGFTVEEGKIRFGLAAVKNVGEAAIVQIISARADEIGFKSFIDFCKRIDLRVVNRRVIESLIYAGSFDALEKSRASLLSGLDNALDFAARVQQEKSSPQITLFGGIETEQNFVFPEVTDYGVIEKLALEKGVLGFYLTGHPLDSVKAQLKEKISAEITELEIMKDGQRVIIGGLIITTKKIITKKGETMAAFTLEDLTGRVEVLTFPQLYANNWRDINEDNIILVKGRMSKQDEDYKIIAEEIMMPDKQEKKLFVKFKDAENAKMLIPYLNKIFEKSKGNTAVMFFMEKENKIRKLDASLWVEVTPIFLKEVESLVGKDNFKLG